MELDQRGSTSERMNGRTGRCVCVCVCVREREREDRKEVGGCGGGWCRFAKRGLPLGCFARGVVERVYGRGMEVSLQSLRRVSSAPRCRPFSLPVCTLRMYAMCA